MPCVSEKEYTEFFQALVKYIGMGSRCRTCFSWRRAT